MNEAIYTRHAEIIPKEARYGKSIVVIGAGAIGSWTVLSLAKMGFANIQVIDPDVVDIVNVGNQLYGEKWIGLPKVDALQAIVEALTSVKITATKAKWDKSMSVPMCDVCIVAVDNMKTRSELFTAWSGNKFFTLGIDPRMGAETLLLYRYTTDKTFGYENTLYSDDDALRESCTAKATVYTAGLISGLVCKMVKDYALNSQDSMNSVQWDVNKNMCVINKEHMK